MENKTPQRDVEYGAKGNALYIEYKANANACFIAKEFTHTKILGENCLANLVEGIENPKIFFSIPHKIDKESIGYKAAREGVEDAYLERGLPSPFPNRTPTTDRTKAIN